MGLIATTDEVVQDRANLVQKVIDRLVSERRADFYQDLVILVGKYPDNERPLDASAGRLITLNGKVHKHD